MIIIPKPFVVRDLMSDCHILRGIEYWQMPGGKHVVSVATRTVLRPTSLFNMVSLRVVMRKTP